MILSGWSLNNKYQKKYLTLPGLKTAEDKRERRERLKAVVKGKRQTRISQIDTKKTNLTAPATQHVGQEGAPRTGRRRGRVRSLPGQKAQRTQRKTNI